MTPTYNKTHVSGTPLVSIITPVYNRSNYLGETIESVLAQTFTDWELLIIDDGSDLMKTKRLQRPTVTAILAFITPTDRMPARARHAITALPWQEADTLDSWTQMTDTCPMGLNPL